MKRGSKTKKARIIHVIELDTRHFAFEAYGATAQEAIDALWAAIDKHIQQTGADRTYFEEVFPEMPREVVLGYGYRDGDIVR